MQQIFTEEIDARGTLAGPHTRALWESAQRIRIYAPDIIPGPLQESAYTSVIQDEWARILTAGDLDVPLAGAAIKRFAWMRAAITTLGKSVSILLEEEILRRRIGNAAVMKAQLTYLRSFTLEHPQVSVEVICSGEERKFIAPAGFMIFDDDLVAVDVPHMALATMDPEQVHLYGSMFETLSGYITPGSSIYSCIESAWYFLRL